MGSKTKTKIELGIEIDFAWNQTVDRLSPKLSK